MLEHCTEAGVAATVENTVTDERRAAATITCEFRGGRRVLANAISEIDHGRIIRELPRPLGRPERSVRAMPRTAIAISCSAMALGGLVGTASASPPANAPASCVGIITSDEATQLPPGSVGEEVSGLALTVSRLGQALVSPLARETNSG